MKSNLLPQTLATKLVKKWIKSRHNINGRQQVIDSIVSEESLDYLIEFIVQLKDTWELSKRGGFKDQVQEIEYLLRKYEITAWKII